MRALNIFLLVVFVLVASSALAHETPLESRVDRLERELNDRSAGALLFLFGAFCALWAQNTGRNAWLWFFLGGLFNMVTILFLLWKNAGDRRVPRSPSAG